MKCAKCDIEIDSSYRSNKGESVCSSCSWYWPVDKQNNVLIDPSTLGMTKDTYDELGKRLGLK